MDQETHDLLTMVLEKLEELDKRVTELEQKNESDWK